MPLITLPPPAVSPPQVTDINSLPPELSLMILESCRYPEYLKLRQTSTRFREAKTNVMTVRFNSEARKKDPWPNRSSYPCYNCGQFPLSYHFADDEIRGRKCRGGDQATTRICLQCALAEHIYQPGDRLVHQRKVHHVCRGCELFCSIYEYPHKCDPVPMTVPQYGLQAQQRALEYNVWVHRRTTRAGVF